MGEPMEYHIRGERGDISRYVLCPGSQSRARQIAEQFENLKTISDDRGIVIYSGSYRGVFMTSCGTGMGGPAVGIATEELAHLGADTFIRVGSCGVFQAWQKPGDVIIATGSYRGGGTGNAYLPLAFPAVPTFAVTRALVEAAERLNLSVTVGVGWATDAFYGPLNGPGYLMMKEANAVSIEMESDTLFLIGQVRGWRTGAIFASDGAAGEIKPEAGHAAFKRGEAQSIEIALNAMLALAQADAKTP
jgi:uridine phosphorylase